MERRKIEPSEIREGDLIRVEQRGYEAGRHAYAAVEACAGRTGRLPAGFEWCDADVFLLDRPVVVPTRPYSLVVPPGEVRFTSSAYVLEPDRFGENDSRWYKSGETQSVDDVEAALRDGWVAIDGPEVLS